MVSLLYIQVDMNVLATTLYFWDPIYKCFKFNTLNMSPTIEEYQDQLLLMSIIFEIKM